jgi:FKBP-type peptidyl-prolyl cis-trans isomerase FkpA
MSRSVVLLLCVVLAMTGCKKSGGCPENNAVAPAAEGQLVQDYLTTNSISATKHKSNMYYQIVTPGTGGSPNQCSTVLVKYSIKLTNGSTVPNQPTDNIAFNLQGLIPAWIQGIPLLQKGGSIRLFVPPSLAYGSQQQTDANGNVTIPANSILIFDINLVDFQ